MILQGTGTARPTTWGRHTPTIITVGALALLSALAGAGCYVTPPRPVVRYAPPPPPIRIGVAVPPPSGPAPVYQGQATAQSGPFEVGCSYSGNQLPGGPGAVFQVACPGGCDQSGGLWGTETYTGDSAICRAGIHMGVISPAGGVVTVRLEPGRPAYRGSWGSNNVQSSDYGTYSKSYVVLGAPAAPPAASAPPPPPMAGRPPPPAASGAVIEPGCSFGANAIKAPAGTSHMISCPPGCAGQGPLWGTDVYTGDSSVCRAAIHAGVIAPNGGMALVTLEGARPAFRGSHRNGVESHDYGSYPSSFRVTRP